MRWYREPLLHFICLGGLVFLYHEARRLPPPATELPIVISQEDVNQLRSNWQKEQGRPVQEDELRVLAEQMVREEILFREALKFGLEQTDVMIRRQLITRMEELLLEFAKQAEPSDPELRSFLERPGNGYPKTFRDQDWEQMRPQLRAEWLVENRRQALDDMFASYRRNYEVILPVSLAPVLERTP